MSRSDRDLILRAARTALETRRALSIGRHEPAVPVDAAGQLGAQVWLRDLKSVDGVYSAGGPPLIVLSSLRPLGRTAFTCAHEVGHHVFGHGTKMDQVEDEPAFNDDDEEEALANSFAAHFLMPRSALMYGFRERAVDVRQARPLEIMRVSSWLGVGYGTLVNHLSLQLKAISWPTAQALKKGQPKALKEEIVGASPGVADLLCIDAAWKGRPIDCRVDDYLYSAAELQPVGSLIERIGVVNGGSLYRALRVGRCDCTIGGEAGELRVGRRGWTGRAIYRYEEEDGE